LSAAFLVAQFISSPLAGLLMTKSDRLAMAFSTSMVIISFLATLIFPETLENVHESSGPDDGVTGPNGHPSLAVKIFRSLWVTVADVWKFVLVNPRVVFLAFPSMFFVFGRFVQGVLLQYATKRYDWDWSQAAYKLGVTSLSNLMMNVMILPAMSWLCLTRFHMSPLSKDLWLSRISGGLSVLGAVMIAFAANGYSFSIGRCYCRPLFLPDISFLFHLQSLF
jgi:hypothetical protein